MGVRGSAGRLAGWGHSGLSPQVLEQLFNSLVYSRWLPDVHNHKRHMSILGQVFMMMIALIREDWNTSVCCNDSKD